MSEVFLARQPVFDRELRVCGYELLYRGGREDSARFVDGDAATATVILNAFMEIGLRAVTGGQPAYLNLTRRFLLQQPVPFPQHEVVLEVLEDIEPDAELRGALCRLSRQGYRIALDDYLLDGSGRERLLPCVDMVKVDVLGMAPQEIVRHARTLQRQGVPALLAEKIESQEVMELCRAAGFDYFQGFFLSRPSTLSRRSVPHNRLPLLRLIASLQRPELDVREIERIIGQDVSLSYKILRYLASPLFPTRDIDSIRAAVLYLGRRQLANWAVLLAMTSYGDQPSERIVALLVRARTCEQLVRHRHGGSDPGAAFTVGLFSGLDAVLDAPLSVICAELPLSTEVRQALLELEGPYGGILAAVLAQERGDWERLAGSGIEPLQVNHHYLEALRWADAQWAWLAHLSRAEHADRHPSLRRRSPPSSS
ncbi:MULTISPECIES: EAL and HDOD domain-containing protein [unclassified Halorhodospira]|uniref:EAL and HDOD domain-containing protein n=1 Tax=unclassified Halorhodospira TaxID=2626748 RepID=UPI001EE8645F|nr:MULTISPECIES: EAL domain-containing protein [unclassified Halorhodospira]MCG5540621.1 EAL domain-containing protein [Halorhodospira sp. M39old]MCG5546742.1 EAL domain-containing protein [Halorhodospira sp. M38]